MLSHPSLYPGFAQDASTTPEATLDELYFALKGLLRLDDNAETSFFSSGCTPTAPNRNGFFIRDDVPAGFHSYFPGVGNSASDEDAPSEFQNEMSQDQVYHLLHGLAFI